MMQSPHRPTLMKRPQRNPVLRILPAIVGYIQLQCYSLRGLQDGRAYIQTREREKIALHRISPLVIDVLSGGLS